MSWLNYLIYEPQQLQTQTHLWQPEEQPKSRTKSWGQINFHFANQIYCTLCRGLFNYLAGARERARCEQQRWGERFSAIISLRGTQASHRLCSRQLALARTRFKGGGAHLRSPAAPTCNTCDDRSTRSDRIAPSRSGCNSPLANSGRDKLTAEKTGYQPEPTWVFTGATTARRVVRWRHWNSPVIIVVAFGSHSSLEYVAICAEECAELWLIGSIVPIGVVPSNTPIRVDSQKPLVSEFLSSIFDIHFQIDWRSAQRPSASVAVGVKARRLTNPVETQTASPKREKENIYYI